VAVAALGVSVERHPCLKSSGVPPCPWGSRLCPSAGAVASCHVRVCLVGFQQVNAWRFSRGATIARAPTAASAG
jgi:hypothetical protein